MASLVQNDGREGLLVDWSFWINWYENLLAGRPQNRALLTDIALIPDADWAKGPAHVNAMIAEIVEKHASVDEIIRQNPYAHKIEVDAKCGRLVASSRNAPDLSQIEAAIRQALKDFTARCRKDKSANRLGIQMNTMFAPVISDLRRDLRRYRSDPLTMFDHVSLAQRELERIAKNEGFSADGPFARLVDALETQKDDICVAVPDVAETQRNRLAVRVARYTDEQRAMALRLCAGMAADSEGVLHAAAALAIQKILDPESSEEETKSAWYFMTAAIPRGARAIRASDMKEASPKQAKSTLQKVVDGADKLAKLDKGIDAVQEFGTEGAGWVTEFWTQVESGNFYGLLG